MAIQKIALRRSFIGGRLVKRGEAVTVDTGLAGDNLAAPAEVAEKLAPAEAAPKVEPEVDLMADEDPKFVDLDGLTKAELIAQAETEGVEVETDDNKADIVRKIEAKRHG